MVNIDSALKTIYKNDMLPLSPTIADKDLIATFADLDLIVAADQFAVDKGDFELFQSICTDDQLKFGKCNASQVKFTLADVTDGIKGKEFSLTQTVDGGEVTYSMPLGYYTVVSAPKQDDLRFKDITAYDRMKKIDIDVSSWYNGLFPIGTETYTLAQFRASLLTFLGLIEDTSRLPLPNDAMVVKKTLDTSQLSGRTVIEAIEELSGAFGLIGYDGKFNHIILKRMHHDYPQSDYPGTDYPEDEPYDEYLDNYEGIHFEEYRVQPIDKIQIRQEENDVGAVYGTGTNCYIIQGNFLVYGKSATELQTIAQNASVNIFDRGYRPYIAKGVGLPYILPGDFIKYNADDTTAGYVFTRTLNSIQTLQDEYEAKGTEEQKQSFGINQEIIQLKGRSTKIEKSVDGVKVQVSDLDTKLSGEIDILAGQVVLKVATNGNIGYIELNGDPDTELTSIILKADNISLEGLVTVNGKFKVLADGSIEAVNAKFSGNITGSNITGSSFTSEGTNGRTSIANGDIITDYIEIGAPGQMITVQPTQIMLVDSNSNTIVSANGVVTPACSVGGYDVITAGNIGQQSVSYAATAGSVSGSVSYASNAGYASSAGSASSCSTGYLTLSSGTLVAPSGSLWIGQNTVKANTIEQLSSEEFKKNINIYTGSALDLICRTTIKTFNYKTEEDGTKLHLGMIVEEAPSEVISESGESLDIGALVSLSWKAIQQLSGMIKEVK